MLTPTQAMKYRLTATNAVWIATATLHARFPDAAGFAPQEIQSEVDRLHLFDKDPQTIKTHISQHLVATKRANAKPRRMLTELPDGRRRLFLDGDASDDSRKKSPILPESNELPAEFRSLLTWYREWSSAHAKHGASNTDQDPLLALKGTWTFGDAETYLREHRSGWDSSRG